MLRTVEITAELTGVPQGEDFHNLHWEKTIELSLDCFVCERTDRTTVLRLGEERATCSAGREAPRHPAPARIAAFDVTTGQDRLALRAVVDHWWAPFHDAKRDRPASALTRAPWVRLHVGSYCSGVRQSGSFSIQSNMVRPVRETCGDCGLRLAVSDQAPGIRLLA
ncbi:hypothetical protein [Streptomyces sp. NPDC048172]|uniref:hypothetical protein n=1 Tax=Streptomyces sp. NPDC048172 TaxID=3365505 RepID=UPI003712DD99